MLSPKEAFERFKTEFPDSEADSVYDWGDFYTISNGKGGDMVDDDYRIDKTSGEITELDFLEYMNLVQKQPDSDCKVYTF